MIDEFDKNSTEISTTASYVVNPEDIFKVMITVVLKIHVCDGME